LEKCKNKGLVFPGGMAGCDKNAPLEKLHNVDCSISKRCQGNFHDSVHLVFHVPLSIIGAGVPGLLVF
jgi:hypothetical protein